MMKRGKSRSGASLVDPAILTALGGLVVNFNLIEETLALTIWTLLGSEHEPGMCVTAQLAFRGLLNLCCSLYYLRAADDPDTVASIQSLRVRLEAIEQRRNELLHSMWAMGLRPGFAARRKATAKAKRGLVTRLVHTSPAAINAVADEMTALSDELLDLFLAFWEKRGGIQEVEGAVEVLSDDEAQRLISEFFDEER